MSTAGRPPDGGRALAAILVLAAGVRVAAALTVGGATALHGDEAYYVAAGRSLAAGLGYPDSVRGPGLPFLIAAVFRTFGESLTAVRLVQAAISLLVVAAVFDLARRRFDLPAAVAGGLICALAPELVHYTHFLWAETLFTTLLVLAVWALDRFGSTARERWVIGAGLGLGLAALAREMVLPFAALAAGWVFWRAGGDARRRARAALVLVAAVAAVVLPWTARNYARHHRVVLVSTLHWFPMAVGNLPLRDGSLFGRDPEEQFASRYFGIPDELEREAMARDVALNAIAAGQPWWLGRKLVRNGYALLTPFTQLDRFERSGWLPPRWAGLARSLLPLEMVVSGVVIGLGLIGLWLVPADRLKPLIVALVLVFLAVYVVANANHRFRVPLLPFLALYGGAWIAHPKLAGRRWRLLGAGASVAALALAAALFLRRGPEPSARPAPAAAHRTSLVLVSIDTLRADHLGAYGYARATSPHFDAFAREGTLFERAYAASTWTLPSHTSMLSGLSPFRHGAVDAETRIPDDVPLVAETLRAQGYQTLGAVGGPFLGSRFGFARGFDRWLERPKSGTDPDAYQKEVLSALALLHPPFFAFVHYMSVHSPYTPPPEFNRFVPSGAAAVDTRVGRLRRLADEGRGRALTPAELETLVGLYDGEILAMDDRLGQTLALLDRLYGADVIVVVTSDHGEEFEEHGNLIHGRTLYDDVLHVPLAVRGPGVLPGRRVADMVSLLDVAPTLLEWAGVPPSDSLDGRSLVPAARDGHGGGTRLLPLHTTAHDRKVDLWGLRTPTSKLILDRKTGRKEFFLLDEDPGERHNLYPDPRAAPLERRLEALTLRAGATRPPAPPEEAEALRALGYH